MTVDTLVQVVKKPVRIYRYTKKQHEEAKAVDAIVSWERLPWGKKRDKLNQSYQVRPWEVMRRFKRVGLVRKEA